MCALVTGVQTCALPILQARNFMRQMQEGDQFFFYHSSCAEPGIAGIGRISRSAYPDPTALDPASPYHDAKARDDANPWSAVDVEFVDAFATQLKLALLKTEPALHELARSEEHTYELQSLMRSSYAVFCLKKKNKT